MGYHVTCVDFVKPYIEYVEKRKKDFKIKKLEVIHGDIRTLSLGEKFNYIICLYDVLGSFADDLENLFIVSSISKHLKQNGRVLLSTMNLELSKEKAIHRYSILKNPDYLLTLPASSIMENTGNIFNPHYYVFDEEDSTFYRKEIFEKGSELPCELIIRDKRYNPKLLDNLFHSQMIKKDWCRPVALGDWYTSLDIKDERAKEILFCGTKY